MTRSIARFVAGVAMLALLGLSAYAEEKGERSFTVHPIGQIQKAENRTLIVLDKKYQPGLLGLDGWSHVQVVWWFDKNDTPQKRAVLQVHPQANKEKPLTGVFACRAPVRPQPDRPEPLQNRLGQG